MFQQDWLMRQIQMTAQFIARIFFKKDYVQYKIVDEEKLSRTDLLYMEIQALLSESNICEAEDLLFANFEEDNQGYLVLAVDFYDKVNQMSDDELEAHNFSREEINEGLNEILRLYGVLLPIP